MPEPEFTSYDRDVLYEQVWAEPVRDLAKRYGVSDVALAKACRRLSVPAARPRLLGQASGRADAAAAAAARGCGAQARPGEPALFSRALAREEEKVPVPEVRVPAGPAPAPRARRRRPRGARGGDATLTASPPAPGGLPRHQRLTEQRQRALRIMDALVRHLEAYGGGVEVSRERDVHATAASSATFVTEAIVGGERVGFALREKQRMHRSRPRRATRSAAGRGTGPR